MNLAELRMKLVENWRGWCLCVHVGICQTDKSKAKSKGLEVDLKNKVSLGDQNGSQSQRPS